MINKKIADIAETDLQALIDNNVLEGKAIEYKRELPNNTDSDKKEFLADVTSFANTSGGDLIFGIEEDAKTRKPRRLSGLGVDSIDSEKTRLDNIIRTGVDPRLHNVTIKPVPLNGSRYALVIRIPRSWSGPHRVTAGGHAKFYARNSSGKYDMDVDELRIAFNLTETLIDKTRNFRIDRIAKIQADETPVPLDSPHRIVLHLIHGNAFNPSLKFDINGVYQNQHKKLPLIYRGAMNGRYNLDGLFTYSQIDDAKYSAYTQLYWNGIIEAVDTHILLKRDGDIFKFIPDFLFEEKLIKATAHYLNLMSALAIDPPFFIFLSLLNVNDYKITTNSSGYSSDSIDRDILLLPAEIIKDHEVGAETILKPIFDLVWNACGMPKSLNFDEDGNWIRRR